MALHDWVVKKSTGLLCAQLWIKKGNPIQGVLSLLRRILTAHKIEKGHQTCFRAASALKCSSLKVLLRRGLKVTGIPTAVSFETLRQEFTSCFNHILKYLFEICCKWNEFLHTSHQSVTNCFKTIPPTHRTNSPFTCAKRHHENQTQSASQNFCRKYNYIYLSIYKYRYMIYKIHLCTEGQIHPNFKTS